MNARVDNGRLVLNNRGYTSEWDEKFYTSLQKLAKGNTKEVTFKIKIKVDGYQGDKQVSQIFLTPV